MIERRDNSIRQKNSLKILTVVASAGLATLATLLVSKVTENFADVAQHFDRKQLIDNLTFVLTPALLALGGATIGYYAAVRKRLPLPLWPIIVLSTFLTVLGIGSSAVYFKSMPVENDARLPEPPPLPTTYQVCRGEFEGRCPPTAQFIGCSDAGQWAKRMHAALCKSVEQSVLSARPGNRCGYSVIELTCRR